MHITREVIYDLLPAYFADEVSADTRVLVEEFLRNDPEFGRMAERFKELQRDMALSWTADSEIDREREAFTRARARFRSQKIAAMWAVGAAVALLVVALTPTTGSLLKHPGVVIGVVFAAMAGAAWLKAGSDQAWPDAMPSERIATSLRRKRRSPRQI